MRNERALVRSEFRICKWVCLRPFRAARFVGRKNRPGETAIVHRSTKRPGKWQVSYFDADGPWSDTEHSSCNAAVEDLRPYAWRLKEVK
jgi:hypothetical protein